MGIADPEAALEKLREFRELQEEAVLYWPGDAPPATQEAIAKREPLVEGIAGVLDRASVVLVSSGPRRAIAVTNRLIGILENREDHERILGPSGPALAASRLHQWVWSAAANLWDDGHYGAAVEAASKKVELQTQKKLRSRKRYGKDLYAQAFSTDDPKPDAPRLRFPHVDEAEEKATWTSAHEGAQHLGMGCAQGIRNLRAHPSEDISEPDEDEKQEALEHLAALSVLARWVDACEVVKVDPSST